MTQNYKIITELDFNLNNLKRKSGYFCSLPFSFSTSLFLSSLAFPRLHSCLCLYFSSAHSSS